MNMAIIRRRRTAHGPHLVVNSLPSISGAGLVVGATLSSLLIAGTYTWPGGAVTETWSWVVDDVPQAGSYVVLAGDRIVTASVSLTAAGMGPYVIAVGPALVANSAPVAGDVSLGGTVVAGTATAPAQMGAPTLTSTATRITITKAADPANGGSAITGYDYRYSTDGGTSWSAAAALTSPQVQAGFTAGATGMLVQERANNAIGNGAWSASASVDMKSITYLGYVKLPGHGVNIVLDLTTLVTDTGGIGGPLLQDDVGLVVWGWSPSSGDATMTVNSAGWTKILDEYISNTRSINTGAAWKAMGATPDTSLDVNASNAAGSGGGAIVNFYRYVDPASPFDAAFTSAKGNGNALADPPAITPTTTGALIWMFGSATGDISPAVLTVPSGVTGSGNVFDGGSSRGYRVTTARSAWTSGAYDPAAFGSTESASTDGWIAGIAALKPW